MPRRSVTVFVGVALVLAVVGAVYLGLIEHRDAQHARTFATVNIGDTEDIVRTKMGNPSKIRARLDSLWCQAAECESEFMYGQSFPPEWWVVGFNNERRVVWVAHLHSP